MYSSVCGLSFNLTHLLLPFENITSPPSCLPVPFLEGIEGIQWDISWMFGCCNISNVPVFVPPWHVTREPPRAMSPSCVCYTNRFTFVCACLSQRLPGYLAWFQSRMFDRNFDLNFKPVVPFTVCKSHFGFQELNTGLRERVNDFTTKI